MEALTVAERERDQGMQGLKQQMESAVTCAAAAETELGRVVQVEPMKFELKAPRANQLTLKYDELLSNFAFNFKLAPLQLGAVRGQLAETGAAAMATEAGILSAMEEAEAELRKVKESAEWDSRRAAEDMESKEHALGEAVQIEPMQFVLKAPGTRRLKLKYDELLSTFAFESNSRHYSWVACSGGTRRCRRPCAPSAPTSPPPARQGLTLVHFSAQREHFVSHVVGCFCWYQCQKQLRLSKGVDECKPLARGHLPRRARDQPAQTRLAGRRAQHRSREQGPRGADPRQD